MRFRARTASRALDLFENVAHGLFAVSVFACLCGQFQNRRMPMFGRRNHHRHAAQTLHDHERVAVIIANVVDSANLGMIEG